MNSRRTFLQGMLAMTSAVAGGCRLTRGDTAPNVLLITADDLNWDSVGAFGCKVPDVTPNIDRLAAEGMRFEHAHVTVSVCQPCRSVLMTGRYPHRNGAEGFEPINPDVPTLPEQLHVAGYVNGIMSKNAHLEPRARFFWDHYIASDQLERGRDPELYYEQSKLFFESVRKEGRPFFLMANADDPHRPFAGSQDEFDRYKKHVSVRRTYHPDEVVIPPFLPDLPDVRKEIAQYFTSVHRCDETVGSVLRALWENGFEENTLVMFVSDNGISLPFAKTSCYLNSTKTPWIVGWPGQVRAGTVDRDHMISGIDFMPTVLEAVGLPELPGVDGRSFAPALRGERQAERDLVITVFHELGNEEGTPYPMRAIQTRRYGYIWNAWWDGQREFRNGTTMNTLTWAAMETAAKTDPDIEKRVRFHLSRAPEEFYDYEQDPAALNNLIADAQHQPEIARLRNELRDWMKRTHDPLAEQRDLP